MKQYFTYLNCQLLKKMEFFGQYGEIKKLIIINSNNFSPPSHAAYVTFSHEKEASLAILVTYIF
jgi:CCR4-NOT transcription complex subunit 4